MKIVNILIRVYQNVLKWVWYVVRINSWFQKVCWRKVGGSGGTGRRRCIWREEIKSSLMWGRLLREIDVEENPKIFWKEIHRMLSHGKTKPSMFNIRREQ